MTNETVVSINAGPGIRSNPDLRADPDIRTDSQAPTATSREIDGDIAIRWVGNHGEFEMTEDGDLATDAGLETAVAISLFTDNRAGDDDELPAAETDRRGWWGGEIGSKLWLLRREKQMGSVIVRAEEYARAALLWMTEDGVASKVAVTGSNPRTGWLMLDIEISRPDGKKFSAKYEYAWESQKVRRIA